LKKISFAKYAMAEISLKQKAVVVQKYQPLVWQELPTE